MHRITADIKAGLAASMATAMLPITCNVWSLNNRTTAFALDCEDDL